MLRIGELSRRAGVSDHVLRAWEVRYGLLTPVRSSGGFRLYSDSDERRVRRMQFHIAQGLSAAEAARLAIAEAQPAAHSSDLTFGSGSGALDLHGLARSLQHALDDLDEGAAQAVLDRLLSDFTLATTLRDVVTPYLRQLGERWERGGITIAQEHYVRPEPDRGRYAGDCRGRARRRSHRWDRNRAARSAGARQWPTGAGGNGVVRVRAGALRRSRATSTRRGVRR